MLKKLTTICKKYFVCSISGPYLKVVGQRKDGAYIYKTEYKKHWHLKRLHKGI